MTIVKVAVSGTGVCVCVREDIKMEKVELKERDSEPFRTLVSSLGTP